MSANTPIRRFRASDDLWEAAKQQAATEGTTISEHIRAALTTWTTQEDTK